MSNKDHDALTTTDGIHPIPALSYANAANRAAHTSATGDPWAATAAASLPTGLVAHQTDDDSYWLLTVNNAGTLTWVQIDGLAGSTGATDNRVLRADGTGGLTVQSSAVAIDDSGNVSGVGNITLSGTVDGRDVATDGTKLDGIEAAADVTDATNVNAAGAVMESDYTAKGVLLAGSGVGATAALTAPSNAQLLVGQTAQTGGMLWSDSSTVVDDAGALMNSDADAKGDIFVATADNTVTNLAVGTDGQVLTADSAEASGVKWAAAAGGGIGGSTGATDNRILRADGTGGSTAQSSAVTIDDSGNMTGVGVITATDITVTSGFTSEGDGDMSGNSLQNVANINLSGTAIGLSGTWRAPDTFPILTNGDTVSTWWRVPFDLTITAVRHWPVGSPVPTGGSLEVTDVTGGNVALLATNPDTIAGGTALTPVSHTLTATSANLDLAAGDIVLIKVASGTAGYGVDVDIDYDRR